MQFLTIEGINVEHRNVHRHKHRNVPLSWKQTHNYCQDE